jgi:ADP-ribose pyrophosphatase YjhB (NUDIX family)
VIKVYVRAIVPTGKEYLLMGDRDKSGEEVWDLPGGELVPGLDVKQHLRKLVLERTGYSIVNMQFYEIVCRIRPRSRGVDPETIVDFVFTSKIEPTELQSPSKAIELLPYERFEWLESGGQFRENKVIALLSKYHRKHAALTESHLRAELDAPSKAIS